MRFAGVSPQGSFGGGLSRRGGAKIRANVKRDREAGLGVPQAAGAEQGRPPAKVTPPAAKKHRSCGEFERGGAGPPAAKVWETGSP
jgi:hypothetical protein